MKYKVESDFLHKGLRCVVILSRSGYRYGYVGIPVANPLYGVRHFNKYHAMIPMYYFDVHGGITYSGSDGNYPVESDLWWFGFNCDLSSDGKDYDKVREYKLRDSFWLDKLMRFDRKNHTNTPFKTIEYVESECKNLANQLSKFVIDKDVMESIGIF